MNCSEARNSFVALLADHPGDLDAQSASQARAHLAACASCAAEFALLFSVAEDLGALEILPAPPGLTESVMAKLGAAPTPAPAVPKAGWAGWKAASLGLAGAAALATGVVLMPASGPVRPAGDAAPRQALSSGASSHGGPAVQATAGAAVAPRASASETESPAPSGPAELGAGPGTSAAASEPATLPASSTAASATLSATAPAVTSGQTHGPSLPGPHIEQLDRTRDGRPLDASAGDAPLDQPLGAKPD